MTPQQWLVAQLTPVIQTNNPGASSDECAAFAGQLAGFYITYILPNIKTDLTTGLISFIVPGS